MNAVEKLRKLSQQRGHLWLWYEQFGGVVEADEGVEIMPIDKKFKVFCEKGSSKVGKVEDDIA